MSLELIKKLREQTGAGMSECKKAVEESGGVYDEAVRILRERGQQIASKKSSRTALEGLVGWSEVDGGVLIVEINCETDFVSRGDKFKAIFKEIFDAAKTAKAKSSEDLLSAKIGSQSVQEFLNENIGIIGENIKLGKVYFVSGDNGSVGVYVHNAVDGSPALGSIVSAVVIKSDQRNESVKEMARKVAMHVAASVPSNLSISDVSPKVVESEKAIIMEQLKDTGKPEAVLNKIVEGRISKFFEDIVLLEQPSVFDNSMKIKDWVKAEAKEASVSADIIDFVRIKLGDFLGES